ncbi:alanine racemase [Paenibacillus mesophilus]|uniref:alanine racemase n=1 Tax=Paenibacillus mesophilus TaxID=2582849 RepID=UPI00110D5136|nr:alanine racemase [Paenibacillus mesophilus]TMV47733.1 alanine racemase [Paenibacillus mesophilus]
MTPSITGERPPIGYRHTWAEISLEAIAHNTKRFKENIPRSTALMAVVKANGYGHGAVKVARAAITAGADILGVAFLDEALQLRAASIGHPVLVLGYTPPGSVRAAVEHEIGLTVFSDEVLDEVIRWTEALHKRARVHLKVDTGMNRIGLSDPQAVLALARKAMQARYIELEGVFTHFADADGEDPVYTMRQFGAFQSVVSTLAEDGIQVPLKHCCNSAAAIRYPSMHLDMVRVGIALYGLYPSEHTRLPSYPLRPAMRLMTTVSDLKLTPAGQPVGYGCTFVPDRDTLIATVPIGYADGLSRRLSNKGAALVNGHRVPFAGRVCMDQTMLDVTEVSGVRIGDEVEMFGEGGDGGISAGEAAALMGTIHYEVVCSIGSRVPRVYVGGLRVH